MNKSIYVLVSLALFFHSSMAPACSAFSSGVGAAPLIGKSYDWGLKPGLIYVNKRNVAKQGMPVDPQRPNNFRWISKFGSVTFNQYGREMPNGGMNERGLVIEVLWLDGTKYPAPDSRPALNEGQWAQYALDTYATIDEMAAGAEKMRLSPMFAAIHHLACDRIGACAVFENLEGKLVITRGTAITNNSAEQSAEYLKGFEGFGGSKRIPMRGTDSLDRFVRIAYLQKQFASLPGRQEQVDHAFGILRSVRQEGYSAWNMVYDFTQGEIFFKFLPKGEGIRKIELKGLDFSCKTPVLAFNMSANGTDFAWHDYSYEENLAQLRKVVEHHGDELPDHEHIAERMARYPDYTKCME